MGRGRAKAKQTKVARQLKYGGPQTDLERLEAELRGGPVEERLDDSEETESDPYGDDSYAEYEDDEEDDSDER